MCDCLEQHSAAFRRDFQGWVDRAVNLKTGQERAAISTSIYPGERLPRDLVIRLYQAPYEPNSPQAQWIERKLKEWRQGRD